MSSAYGTARGDTIVQTPAPEKPKSTLQALANIQHYYVAEKDGSIVDENFFTTLNTVEYFEVGFKGAFISGIVAVALTPFAVGVMEQYLPVFGSEEPSLFDKTFVFLLALSFSIGYACFYGTIGKYYIGPITRQMIRWLLAGLMTGAVVKLVLAFILYHWIYFVALSPEMVEDFLLFFQQRINAEKLVWAYWSVMNFKPVFLVSAWFVAASTAIFITVPLFSMAYYKTWRKNIR